jgi:hypothetical protein
MVHDVLIPLEAVPAIRAAVRDPLLLIAGPIDAAVLAAAQQTPGMYGASPRGTAQTSAACYRG